MAAGILAMAAAGVLFLAHSVGESIGRHRASTARDDAFQSLLEENLRGLSRGESFPSLPVWTPDGSQVAEVLDLLPEGGIVFYVMAQCGSCVEVVAILDSLAESLGEQGAPVVVVASPNPDQLLEGLTARGVAAPVWVDQQDILSRDHNIRATRVWFRLGSDGHVEDLGTAGFDPAEYASLLMKK